MAEQPQHVSADRGGFAAGRDIVTYNFSGLVLSEEATHVALMRTKLAEYSQSIEFIRLREQAGESKTVEFTHKFLRRTTFACALVLTGYFYVFLFTAEGSLLGLPTGALSIIIAYKLRAGSKWGSLIEIFHFARSKGSTAPPKNVLNIVRPIRIISVSDFDNSRVSRWLDPEPSALVEELEESDHSGYSVYKVFLDRNADYFTEKLTKIRPDAIGYCVYDQYSSSRFKVMKDFRPSLMRAEF